LGSRNELFITLGLLGLGMYFSVLLVRGTAGYLKFRRLRKTAVVTWPAPPPSNLGLMQALGVTSAILAVIDIWLHRPFHHVYAQAVMTLYFVGLVPLCRGIRIGLYEGGVWADAGFLPWPAIRRMAFHETPDIVLVLLPRHGWHGFQLPVPPGEYGAVRKFIEQKIREHELVPDKPILGI